MLYNNEECTSETNQPYRASITNIHWLYPKVAVLSPISPYSQFFISILQVQKIKVGFPFRFN